MPHGYNRISPSPNAQVGCHAHLPFFRFFKIAILCRPLADLGYGLIQYKGGPCGILASVQAFVIAYLLFGDGNGGASEEWRNPRASEQREALVQALTSMLWRAAGDTAIVVILAEGTVMERSQKFKGDGVTEKLRLCSFRDKHVSRW